ncbi:PIN domain-containing protein [Tenggerimyces flavus]|uniref:NYN domain-containing protein n=1 Tax=Tenggerimyces flavus TaxID=1708749 RepID=A0ABV7YQ73_9ACTN|nr:hypothetical protein [Tenggerimyces flavus]
MDFVRLAIEGAYDVGILFSCDTDLMPALETVAGLGSTTVEVAAWDGTRRLRFAGTNTPWCHYLDVVRYRSCEDTTDTRPVS